MKELNLKSLSQIIFIRGKFSEFDRINIYANSFKKNSVLRIVFKFALWALRDNGELNIYDEPHKTYGFINNKIEFWQVRNELFKSLSDSIKLIKIDEAIGFIKLKKIKAYKKNSGITYGIILGSGQEELKKAKLSIDSIYDTVNGYNNFEIIIIGSDLKCPEIFNNKINLKYYFLDVFENGRILTSKKKNKIFHLAKFNLVTIFHSRIIFTKNYHSLILSKNIEFATPKVNFISQQKKYRYLDFGLLKSYEILNKKNIGRVVSGPYINDQYWYLLKNKVQYIDGGINILNKDLLKYKNIYNDNIAWGEAEDLELSKKIHSEGFLIDFLFDVECKSSTNKLKLNESRAKFLLKKCYYAIFKI